MAHAAGKLNNRAVIQRDAGNTSTDSGDAVPAWTTEATIWAGFNPADPKPESMQLDAPRAGQLWTMLTRYYAGASSNRRVLRRHDAGKIVGAINSSTTSITTSKVLRFAGCAGDLLLVGSEIMRVVGGSGTANLTVVRGAHNTTAASHADQSDAVRVELLEVLSAVADYGSDECTWDLVRVDA